MKKILVALKDTKADYFLPPCLVNNVAEAHRMMIDIVNSNQDMPICKHPEDFSLYHIADFDIVTGAFVSDGPRCLGVGTDFVNKGE